MENKEIIEVASTNGNETMLKTAKYEVVLWTKSGRGFSIILNIPEFEVDQLVSTWLNKAEGEIIKVTVDEYSNFISKADLETVSIRQLASEEE